MEAIVRIGCRLKCEEFLCFRRKENHMLHALFGLDANLDAAARPLDDGLAVPAGEAVIEANVQGPLSAKILMRRDRNRWACGQGSLTRVDTTHLKLQFHFTRRTRQTTIKIRVKPTPCRHGFGTHIHQLDLTRKLETLKRINHPCRKRKREIEVRE